MFLDWITTANGLLSLIIGLCGLIGTGISTYFAVKAFIKAQQGKSINEIWNMIMTMADAAMKAAEQVSAKGEDKKAMVIESVKASCLAAGVDISSFADQLSAYIDQSIDFVNNMTKDN